MKVAIVGIGHVARYQMDAIRQLAGVELVGVYDGDVAAVNRHAVSCRVHGSLDDLIENSSADVVVVSTCNSDHFATASRLLGAGRAVMVEKPVCENPEDLNSLAKLAKAAAVFFHAAFHAAFARDLIWWIENREALAYRYGAIEGFDMGFYDPYIESDGAVKKSARKLGGSWYDSGINALTVLARIADPASITFVDGHMFVSPHIACHQVNGSAQFRGIVDGDVCTGQINTDWALGLDRKVTMLSYKRATVLLDHSNEQVIIRDGGERPEIISLQNGLPRLTNHYVGVFADLKACFARGSDNAGLSAQLHSLLFAAAKKRDDGGQGNVWNLKRSSG